MKKIVLSLLVAALGIGAAFSQAKKPTIMVVPSDVWMNQNGYMMTFDNMGTEQRVPDYTKALQSNPELLLAVSKIGEMMAERGFPLKNLESSLKSLQTQEAEESVTMSKDGDMIAESPVDKLKRVANADIWMQLTWTINTIGPKRSLTFNLQGLDAYTDKQIAAASGTGAQSFSVELPVLLEEAILVYIDNFNNQLQAHFDDMFTNGREITLTCRRWSGSDVDFESEFEGEELSYIIEDWLAENTVQGRFSTSSATENRLAFEQVRIPLENAQGRAIDARRWADGLRRMLSSKYGIDAKLGMKGLGGAILTIGGK